MQRGTPNPWRKGWWSSSPTSIRDLSGVRGLKRVGSHFSWASKNSWVVESPLGCLNLVGFRFWPSRFAALNMSRKKYSRAGVVGINGFVLTLLNIKNTSKKIFSLRRYSCVIRPKYALCPAYLISSLHSFARALSIYIAICVFSKSASSFACANASFKPLCSTVLAQSPTNLVLLPHQKPVQTLIWGGRLLPIVDTTTAYYPILSLKMSFASNKISRKIAQAPDIVSRTCRSFMMSFNPLLLQCDRSRGSQANSLSIFSCCLFETRVQF